MASSNSTKSLARALAIREGYQKVIELCIEKIETCEKHTVECGCDCYLKSIREKMVLIRTQNEIIRKHSNGEVNETESYNKRIAEIISRLENSIKVARPERRLAKPKQSQEMMKYEPVKQLIFQQKYFARNLEIAYIYVVDKPLTAKEIRMTAHEARNLHMSTLELMKISKVTADHIIELLLPMIREAVEEQDSTVATEALEIILEEAQDIYKKAKESCKSCMETLGRLQLGISSVNDAKFNEEKREKELKILLESKRNLESLLEEHKKNREKHRDEAENMYHRLNDYCDNRAKVIDQNQGAVLETLAMLGAAALVATGPIGAGIGACVAGIGALSLVGKHFKRSQACNQYMDGKDMALECVRQKIKLQDEVSKTQFEMFENQTAITGLTREQEAIDVESLKKALLPLGKVDSVLVHVTQFWGDFARAVDMMVKNTKTTNLFAGLKTQNQIDQLYNSLDIVEYQWESYGKLCEGYVNQFDKKISPLYGFMTAAVEDMPRYARQRRIGELTRDVQQDELAFVQQNQLE